MTNKCIEKIIAIAKQEVGYLEKKNNSQLDGKTINAGSANYTKYARDLDNINYFGNKINGYAWCATFVNWLLVQAFGKENAQKITGQPSTGSLAASCSSAVNYYKKAGTFITKNPKPGDQIFFTNNSGKSFNHTGLVTAVSNGRVYTIEGNTSSAAGVVDNGGCVREKSYLLTYNKIGGYGRPKYELLEDEEEMTQEQFNKMFDTRIAQLSVQPATFEQEALDWAENNGIMNGNTAGQQMPKKYITRGEFIVVLKRFFDKFIKK